MIDLTLINTLNRFLIYEKRNINAVEYIKNGGFWNGLKPKKQENHFFWDFKSLLLRQIKKPRKLLVSSVFLLFSRFFGTV